MYSLRTDDIPGARPRLRHYEKKLIREPERTVPQGYIPSFPTLEEIKLQIEAKGSQPRDQILTSQVSQATRPSSKAKLVLPQEQPHSLKDVELSESYMGQPQNPPPRYRKSSLQLPENERTTVHNPQEHIPQQQQLRQPIALAKPQSPMDSRSMMSSQHPPSRARPLIEGTTFNIITNHRMQYKIEPLGYVPSWS